MTAAITHDDVPSSHPAPRRPIPVGVQVLSTILYGAFAITVTVIALNQFWPAGVALVLGTTPHPLDRARRLPGLRAIVDRTPGASAPAMRFQPSCGS